MVKRNKKGQFVKGSKPMNGFKKGMMTKEKHPMWKGGLPNCKVCGKTLKSYRAKFCVKHSFTPERIEKIKAGRRKCIGKKHHNWKGNDVGYTGLHNWVRKTLGTPKRCDKCGNNKLNHRQYHWANKSGKYKRIKSDWIRLCVKCHIAFDKKPKTKS